MVHHHLNLVKMRCWNCSYIYQISLSYWIYYLNKWTWHNTKTREDEDTTEKFWALQWHYGPEVREITSNYWMLVSYFQVSVLTHCIRTVSEKKTGLNKDMMWWMYNTAIGAKLPACGYFGGLVLDEDEHPERHAGFKQRWPMETCWLYRLRRGVQCHEHYVQEQELIAACWPCASILVPWPDWLEDAVCLFPNKPGKFSRLVSKCLGLNKFARWLGSK